MKITLQASTLVEIIPVIPDITEVISAIDHTLPQMSSFIERYYNLLISSNVNVSTESQGQIFMDVLKTMPEPEVIKVQKEISVLDRLITTHHQTISEKIREGLEIENRIKLNDPNYKSQLLEKINEFKKLESKYSIPGK